MVQAERQPALDSPLESVVVARRSALLSSQRAAQARLTTPEVEEVGLPATLQHEALVAVPAALVLATSPVPVEGRFLQAAP